VFAELLEHPLTDDRMLRSMVEDVNLPEAEQDLSTGMPQGGVAIGVDGARTAHGVAYDK
jgi:hypothetical protein